MSNPVNLNATRFENYMQDEDRVSFGWYMYDDENKTYANFGSYGFSDDLELLKSLESELNDVSKALLLCVYDMKTGMNINGNWYDYEEIEEVLKTVLDL